MNSTYQLVLSHASTIFVTFFAINSLGGLIDYLKLKEKNAYWHILMSFFIGIYTLFLGINTHIESNHISNSILLGHWVVSYLALFCYLKAIEYYLQKDLKILIYPKVLFLFISISYIVSQVIFQLTKNSIFLKETPLEFVTYYSKYSYITMMGSTIGTTLGIIGIIFIVFSCTVIWLELNKTGRNEWTLKLGIILCLLTGAYDTAIGLGYLKTQLPLFYLAFALESIRLYIHNKEVIRNKVANLEGEITRLSKVAQFGVTTASISHDIKNHLFVVDTLVKRLKKLHGDEEFDNVLKHTNEINNVTNLYTNLFKKNLINETSVLDVDKLIDNTRALIRKKIKKGQIGINFTVDKNFEIDCNETEITLCLVNLINNSIEELMDLEDRWIEVIFDSNKRSIKVIDSGKGVDHINPSKLFEYDYSTKKSEGGTGIGLAIARQLLRKSGHELTYIAQAKNTTFEISFN